MIIDFIKKSPAFYTALLQNTAKLLNFLVFGSSAQKV